MNCTLALCGRLSVICAFLWAGSAVADGEKTLEINLSVEKTTVEAGKPIRLRATCSPKVAEKVVALGFWVHRLGHFDEKLGKIVLRSDHRLGIVDPPDEAFRDLPGSRIGPHGIPFDIETPTEVGFEHKVTPTRLGVFILTARWRIDGEDDYVVSNPVTIVVRPPTDKNGKPKLDREWLKKN